MTTTRPHVSLPLADDPGTTERPNVPISNEFDHSIDPGPPRKLSCRLRMLRMMSAQSQPVPSAYSGGTVIEH